MEKPKPPKGIKVCAVCGAKNVRVMHINGDIGRAKNLAGLVQKYGEITVFGVMCLKCVRRVLIIHKHATRFHDLCHKKGIDNNGDVLSRGCQLPVNDGTDTLDLAYCLQSLQQMQSRSPVIHLPQANIGLKHLTLKSIDMPLSVLRPIAPKPPQSDMRIPGNDSLVDGTPTSILDLGSRTNSQELQVNQSVSTQLYESVITSLIEGALDPDAGSPPPPKKPKLHKHHDDWDSKPFGDHTYGKALTAEEILKKHADEWIDLLSADLLRQKSQEMISPDNQNILLIKASEGKLSKIAEAVLKMPKLRAQIMACLMSDVSNALTRISNRKRGNLSCLKPKGFEDNMNFDWNSVIREMDVVSPELLKLCMAMLFKPDKTQLNSVRMAKETIPKIGVVFAVLVQGRFRELTKVQRIISLVLRRNGCNGKAVWQKMNPLGLCLSYTSMITLEHGLCANQTTSQSCKITADGTQEDSATVLAQEAKKGTTFESKKTPAKKPILKIIRKTVTSDQGSGTTNNIPDYSSGEFSNRGPGTGTDEAVPVPSVATTNTNAIEHAASRMSMGAVIAQEAKRRTTPKSKETPAKKPILKIIQKTVTFDQGSGTTNNILDCSSGEFSNEGRGTGTDETVPVPAAATTNTMAIENAASKMSTNASELNTQNYSSELKRLATQVSDTQQDDLSDSDFVFQGMTF
ncbi:uncharacterized protein [Asterias amurensis]|uniref:uncharacterized protein n=1 Tax=Asterias amurensis TaxID=7602 RepID=UPI003AB64057